MNRMRLNKRQSGSTLLYLIGLLFVVGAIAFFHFNFVVHKTDNVEQIVEVHSNVVENLEVSPHKGRLCVTFFTHNPTCCRLGVGYTPSRQTFKQDHEQWFARQHTLRVENLLPGKIYLRIDGKFKNGSSFNEPVKEILIPADDISCVKTVAAIKSEHPAKHLAAKETEQHTTGAISVLVKNVKSSAENTSMSSSEANLVALVQQAPTTATAEISQNSTNLSTATSATEAVLVASIDESDDGDYEEEDPFNKLPKVDPTTELGKRALSASKIARAFGPGSLKYNKREQLLERIKVLHKEYEDYDDAQGARELAQAYLELRDYRKALQYATAGVRHSPKDIGSHRIRLKVYKKFAMGWKVQETYKKLVDLQPKNQKLHDDYARDKALFGKFKTIGKAQRVEIK